MENSESISDTYHLNLPASHISSEKEAECGYAGFGWYGVNFLHSSP